MKKALQSIVLLLGVLMLPTEAYAQDIYGDLNGDGEVNIADINAIIDVILSDVSNSSADVNNDNEINIADINAVINIILGGSASTHGHEYVDLGLPSGTLWATCNVGASSPEDYGDYFAWGETEPKDNYDWSTYKWCDGSGTTLTKYCNISSFGMVDNKTDLLPEVDAAYVNWSPEWRMPTDEQQDELHRRCNWSWTTQNGVDGRLVTGPNGTFERYLKSRYDTLKDYDSVIYEKLPSRNIRLNPLLYYKRGVHCITPKNPPLFIKQERSDLKEIIARLNERLDEPFVTAGTVTGDKGIKQVQDEYQRLMNNESPKSKRKSV